MRPLLIINPIGDAVFEAACEDAMDPPQPDPESLQDVLRERYPSAVVRPRALSGEVQVVWYVYRDGHWVSSA